MQYLENNNKPFTGQHAYRRHHSTTTCLVEITEFLHKNMDQGRVNGITSMDLSKAFDSVSHNLLIQKLSFLGFAGSSLEWIGSYLSGRTQQVKFQNHLSEVREVGAGVPQGSILGPILFIAFTADMAEHLHGFLIKAYADDTQILVDGKNTSEVKQKLQKAIAIAQQWFKNNSLQINPTKTEIIIVGNQKFTTTNLSIDIEEKGKLIKIAPSTHIKILGVTIDNMFTWKRHIRQLKGKVVNTVRHLARSSRVLTCLCVRTWVTPT